MVPPMVGIKEEVRVKGEFKMNEAECGRRIVFCSYKPATTILTNLQRGNVQTEVAAVEAVYLSLHQRAGMGDLMAEDLPPVERVDCVDDVGYTALLWAAAYGQMPTVRLLLEHGADPNVLGRDGETALMLSACGGHFEIVRLLVLAGVNVNLTDHFGNTALMFAAYSNSSHTTHELLVAGADITRVNLHGQSALSVASAHSSHLALSVMERYLTKHVLPRVHEIAVEQAHTLTSGM